MDRRADVRAAHRRRPACTSSTPTAPGLAISIGAARGSRRRRMAGPPAPQHLLFASASCASSAGRRSPNASTAPAPRSPICCGCRRRALLVSTFTLEDDAVVAPSTLLDEVRGRGTATRSNGAPADARGSSSTKRWRSSRSHRCARRRWRGGGAVRLQAPPRPSAFRGATTGHDAPAFSLSALERYQDCPFKFFAADVLRLEEAPEDEPTLSPRARGRFIHEVFQRFFEAWDRRGDGTITPDRLDEARALFEEIAGAAAGAAARGRGGARARAPVRLRHRGRHRRRRARPRGVAPGGGPRALARASVRRGRSRSAIGRRTPCRAEGRGRPHRPARGQPPARHRLQVGLPRRSRSARCRCPSTRCARRRRWRRATAARGTSTKPRTSRSAGKRALVPVVKGGAAMPARCWRRRATGCSPCSTASAAASSRRARTSRGCARTARTRRSAARTTSAMSNLRAAVRRREAGRRRVAHRRARPRRPRARRRSALQRRARGIGRHRQDARAGRPLRQPAARRRRSRRTSWRSPSRARPPPRCASASWPRCAPPAERGEIPPRAGASCATARPTSPSARSTRSACRCCASFRSRPTSIRASRWPTRPRCRGSSTRRSTARCASAARSRARTTNVALVFAQLGERRARAGPGGAAATGASSRRECCRDTWRQGPRDLDAPTPPRRGAAALARRVRRHARRPRSRSSRPVRREPPFLLLRAELRRLRAHCDGRRARRRPRCRRLFARVARALPDAGRRAAQRGSPDAEGAVRDRSATGARIATLVVDHAPAGRAAFAALPARSQRAGVARHLADVPRRRDRVPRARSTRTPCSISPTCCCARSTCCGRWRSSRRAATGSSRATTTCWWTSSRTPAARSGSWCRCWSSPGAKAPAWPIPVRSSRRSSSSATASSRSTASATPTSPCCRRRRGYLEALRPDGDVRRSISRSFRSVPPLLAFVNDVCHDIDKAPARARRLPLRRAAIVFRSTCPRADGERVPRRSSLADTPEACAAITAAEIARLLGDRRRPFAIAIPACARAVRPGDIAILFRTRDSHREFEDALERRGIRVLRLQGPRLLRRRRDQGRAGAALVSGRAGVRPARRRVPALALSRHLGRGAAPARAADLPTRLRRRPTAAVRRALEPATPRALAQARAATRRWRALVDRLPPAELLDRSSTSPRTRSSCAGRASSRRART